ncbi:MAG: aspartyl protease family protein [Chthoniobacter sp.]|uniref:aspartyl protease family protein n=1 Tax=Chthoniobacter sp. TaxID=2510640 RepID=UPI0032ABCC57
MHFARLFALFLASWFIVAKPGHAATEIPFTFRAGMIWLKVETGAPSAPLAFLLDSGAGKSVLDLGAARRLGVKLGTRETVQGVDGRCAAYQVDGLGATVGSAPVPRQMLALDLRAVSAGCGARVDGLLGADFFREHIVRIDFAAQKIRLLSANEMAASEGRMLTLAHRNDALCVRAGINGGAPQWMRVDTGCSGALEWVVTGTPGRRMAETSVATAGSSPKSVETEVLLGEERISAVKTGLHRQAMFAGESGLIGNGLLSRFRVTVDAAGGRLLLARVGR